jgi:uncharacterized membrane protein HdeD (DUF308 family)
MEPEEPDSAWPAAVAVAGGWQATLLLGIITLVLGLIVTFFPSTAINVVAVLLGLLMIVSGIFYLIRAFGGGESHRVWLGIAGLLLVVIGVVLLRHLHLTVALIGLIIGISWIVQGLAAIAASVAGGTREGRGWWIAFGIISLIGGIVVTAVPVESVKAIAVLIGIWFIIQGIFEIAGGFMLRNAISKSQATMINPPPRAGEGATAR